MLYACSRRCLGAVAFAAFLLLSCSSFGTGTGAEGAPDAALVDAVADAGTDGRATPGPFCTARPNALLCRDFDAATAADQGWAKRNVPANSVTLSTTDNPPSPTNAARFVLPASSTNSYAQLQEGLPSTQLGGIVFEFQLFIVPPTWPATSVNVAIASLVATREQGNRSYEIFVLLNTQNQLSFSAQLPDFGSSEQGPPLPTNQWVQVSLSVSEPTANELPIDLSVNGVGVASRAITYKTASFMEVHAGIGLINFNPPIPALDFRFDNIEVRRK